MQKHKRCEAVDEHGHRCNRKRNHEHLKDAAGKVVLPKHSAFGREW